MLSTMRTTAVLSLGLSIFSQFSAAATTTASAASSSSTVVAGQMTSAGCFNSSSGLTSAGTYTWQSHGYCQKVCVAKGATVMALSDGNACYCGTSLPPQSSEQSDSSECSTDCVGYPTDDCGGSGYWSVLYTSDDTDVGYYGGSSSSSGDSSSSTTASASKSTSATSTSSISGATVITSVAPGKTVVITQLPASSTSTSTATADSQKSSHHSNTAGIAAGVVVGIVVIAGLIGAAYFFYRRRQRQMAEEAFSKRQQIPSEYSSSRPMTGPDARLDHDAMAHRRLSDGSIADNEDYSRRILKVVNPDDR